MRRVARGQRGRPSILTCREPSASARKGAWAMIVITGGTGTSGRPVVEAVARAAGAGDVRVMVRDLGRARELAALGVELVKGDLEDVEAVKRCCAGAEVMFLNSG